MAGVISDRRPLSELELSSAYELLVLRAGVHSPPGLHESVPGDSDYDRWSGYLREQALIDGLQVEFADTYSISFFWPIALLSAPSGLGYDLPVFASDGGDGAVQARIAVTERDYGEALALARKRAASQRARAEHQARRGPPPGA